MPGIREWTAKLHEARLLCVAWPKEYGGRGLTGIEVSVLNDEFARAGVPRVTRGMGEWLVGPSIIVWGTDEQKAYFLPRIIDGTDRYCQGFSEPDAGSDLASLKTRGVVDGDEVVITGQKVWTSGATVANMMFCLCRTDPDAPKHQGISYVLTPMTRPDGSNNGFELRPIRQPTGSSHFTETFITDARAPLFNVIGGLNNGWRVTMTTLGNERGGNATTQHVQYTKQFWDAVDVVRDKGLDDDPDRAPAPGLGLHPLRDHAHPGAADPVRGRGPQGARAGGVDQQDVLVGVRPALQRADDEHPRRRGDDHADPEADATADGSGNGSSSADAFDSGPGYALDKWQTVVPRHPLGHHLGRHRAGAAQHRRRARPRPAQGTELEATDAATAPTSPPRRCRHERVRHDHRGPRRSRTRRRAASAWPRSACSWPGGPSSSPTPLAVVSEHGDRTFAELNANVNRLVRALRRRGVVGGRCRRPGLSQPGRVRRGRLRAPSAAATG